MAKAKKKKPQLPQGFIMDDVPSPLGNDTDRVLRRIDADSLEWMYHHRNLTEEQYQAGVKYQNAYLVYAAQQNMAIDYAKERVDTSGVMEPITDAQMRAADIVKAATKEIGYRRAYRMQKIAGEGMFVREFCRVVHGLTDRRGIDKVAAEWKEDLDRLSVLWGKASKPKRAA